MKIYTRTGDAGDTGLFGGRRVRKDDARVEAYGAVDELNAMLGCAEAAVRAEAQDDLAARLRTLQADLFAIGANLATPAPEDGGRPSDHIPPVPGERVGEMEAWIDSAEAELPPLRSFILPGGGEAASRLHLCRTVCRRAERRVATLAATAHLDPAVLVYLNRLSDLLFVLARLVDHRGGRGDVPWHGPRSA